MAAKSPFSRTGMQEIRHANDISLLGHIPKPMNAKQVSRMSTQQKAVCVMKANDEKPIRPLGLLEGWAICFGVKASQCAGQLKINSCITISSARFRMLFIRCTQSICSSAFSFSVMFSASAICRMST